MLSKPSFGKLSSRRKAHFNRKTESETAASWSALYLHQKYFRNDQDAGAIDKQTEYLEKKNA